MRNYLLLSLLISFSAIAQVAEKTITLNFASSSSTIEAGEAIKLEEIVSIYQISGFFNLELQAHTDLQGNKHFNERLSFERRKAVEDMLVLKGIPSQMIQGYHFGEERPLVKVSETEDVPENRRVDILVRYHKFEGIEDVFSYTNQNNITQVLFTNDGSQLIEGNSGTQLIIPNEAFQTKEGKCISNKGVVFELEEYSGFGQGISNKLTTISEGKVLESGGMFRIQATFKGEELALREGKEITVQMPSNNIQNGMSVFVGNRDENGNVVWENTEGKFIPIDTSSTPKLPLPGLSERLVANQIELPPALEYKEIEVDKLIPKRPIVPNKPRKPSIPQNPEALFSSSNSFMRFFTPRHFKQQRSVRNYQKQVKLYDKRLERYNRAMKTYESRQAEYLRNHAVYLDDSIQFVAYVEGLLNTRMEDFKSIKSHYDVLRYNRAILSIGNKMNDSLFYSNYLIEELQARAAVGLQNADYFKLMSLYRDIQFLNYLLSDRCWNSPDLVQKNGRIEMSLYQNNVNNRRIKGDGFNQQMVHCRDLIRSNQVVDGQLSDSIVNSVLLDLQDNIRSRKAEAGLFDRKDMQNMYMASVKTMGFINCDRFANFPPYRMAKLEIDKPTDAVAYVIIPRLNSLIPLNSFTKQDLQLPIGEKITVMVIGVHNGKPTYSEEKYVVKKGGNKLKLEPGTVDLEFLKEQLSKL